MANNISRFKKYVPLLDEIYKTASITAVIESDETLAREGANTNEIIIPKIEMDALADYDRNSGYTSGDVTLTNETAVFNYERGRMFSIDAMDNEETADIAFGKLSGEFIRTKVVPELDAVRFAAYASADGISKVSSGADLNTGEEVLAALIVAQQQMDEDEVPTDDRHLFITPALYYLAVNVDTTKSKAVLEEFATINKVPQNRFYTAVTLNDGVSSGEEKGGYKKDTSSGADINFMIIHKNAVMQFTKHIAPKVITPDANPDADAWKFGYRIYGLNDVYANRSAGIYLHHK